MKKRVIDFAAFYAPDAVMAVLNRAFSKAGMNVTATVLQLFYLARSPEVPLWAKTAIFAALGYFVVTPDAIPDVAPVLGFTDDLAVLASALTGVASYVTPEMRHKVRERLQGWFGKSAEEVVLVDETPLALQDRSADA